jgi:hypothetical protein
MLAQLLTTDEAAAAATTATATATVTSYGACAPVPWPHCAPAQLLHGLL